jgi:GTP-binding protein EngB required for normal cell division
MYEYLRKKGHDYIIVATKSDKLNSAQLTQNTEKLNSYFEKDIIPVSSQNNKGIDVIRDLISQCLEQEK